MIAPTLAGSYAVSGQYTFNNYLTTPSFTPQTGDIIVVKLMAEMSENVTFSPPTGGGWTYTQRASDATAGYCFTRIWTAPVISSGVAQTVSVQRTAGGQTFIVAMMLVELWRGGQLDATPATCDQRDGGSGSLPSAPVTTEQANSVVTWLCADWFAVEGSSRTYRSSASEDGYDHDSGKYTAYSAYQSAASAGLQTIGLTAPGGQKWTILGLEVQGASAGPAIVEGQASEPLSAGVTAAGFRQAPGAASVPLSAQVLAAGLVIQLGETAAHLSITMTAEGTIGTPPRTGDVTVRLAAGVSADGFVTSPAAATVPLSAAAAAGGEGTHPGAATVPLSVQVTAAGQAGAQPVGNPSGGPWALVFEDHFDSPVDGKPNPAVWAGHLIEGDALRTNDNPTEVQWYTHDRRGQSVSSSVLSLIARHEDPYDADPLCPNPLPSGQTGTYTSGMIQSHPGFQFTHGYVEARLRLPRAGGAWPAFWMYPADATWPPEFDIEEYTTPQATYWEENRTIHSVNYPGGDYTAWHVFGCRWNASGCAFFLDGSQVGLPITQGPTSLPMHVVVNLAVTTSATGSGFPCQIDVDYIRVWTKEGVPAQPSITSVTPSTGLPSGGQLTVAFGAAPGAALYRATACPIDGEADGWTDTARRTATGSSSPLTISNLQAGVRYSITIAAINATGYSIESLPVPALPGIKASTVIVPLSATITAAGTVETPAKTGDMALPLSVTVAADGGVGAVVSVSLAVTVAAEGLAAHVGEVTAAPEQVSITTAGTRVAPGEMTAPEQVRVAAAGQVTHPGETSVPLSAAITVDGYTGAAPKTGDVAVPLTGTVASGGLRTTTGQATLTATAVVTSEGTGIHSAAIGSPVTVTVTTDGHVDPRPIAGQVSVPTSATVAATAQAAGSSAAAITAGATVTADGMRLGSGALSVLIATTVTAAGTVIRPSAARVRATASITTVGRVRRSHL